MEVRKNPEKVARMDELWRSWSENRLEELTKFRSLLREYRIVSSEISSLNGARAKLGQEIASSLQKPSLHNAIKNNGGSVLSLGTDGELNRRISVSYDEHSVNVSNGLRLNSRGISEIEQLLKNLGIGIENFTRLSVDDISKFLVNESGNERVLEVVKKLMNDGIANQVTHVKVVSAKRSPNHENTDERT